MNQHSDTNLFFLNLLIGLCKGVRGLPRNLIDLGYSVKWIEFKFNNSEEELVKPEIIITSRKLGDTLLFEWKSGGNVDNDQLLRYSKITEDNLTQRAQIPLNCVNTFRLTILCMDEHFEKIKIGIEKNNVNFPVIAKTQDSLI